MGRRETGADKERFQALHQRPETPKTKREKERERRIRDGVVTYRGIPHGLRDQLKDVASKHKVKIGELVRLFLEHALAAYRRGDLQVKGMAETTYALYPDKSGGQEGGS